MLIEHYAVVAGYYQKGQKMRYQTLEEIKRKREVIINLIPSDYRDVAKEYLEELELSSMKLAEYNLKEKINMRLFGE
jgi:hypothetical protein